MVILLAIGCEPYQRGGTMTAQDVLKLHPELTSEAAQEIADAVNRYGPLSDEEAQRTADWLCYMRLPHPGKQRHERSH